MNQVIDGQKTLDRHLVEFVDVLRNVGVKISLGSSLDFGLAVTELGAGSSEDIYWAGRSTLISRPEDISIYNKVFKTHWLGIDSLADEVNKLPALNFLFDDLPDESDLRTHQTRKTIFSALNTRVWRLFLRKIFQVVIEQNFRNSSA